MYTNTESSITLNGCLTSWLSCTSGVRQGDTLSTTLFALFINDLAKDLKRLNKGIIVNDVNIPIVMYADNILLMASNE